MSDRLWRLAIVAGFVTWPSVLPSGDEALFSPVIPPGAVGAFSDDGQGSLPRPAEEARPSLGPTQGSPSTLGEGPAGLPPAQLAVTGALPPGGPGPVPGQPADGTWREDGRYVIINVNGQEMRLLKAPSGPEQGNPPAPQAPAEGMVRGRLLQRGRPLVNCRVVLVPLHQVEGVSCYDESRQPLSVATDDDGVYYFEHVPAGAYKLTWLPEGKTQWIRRIAMKPDVRVRSGENVSLKEIRMATQTIN